MDELAAALRTLIEIAVCKKSKFAADVELKLNVLIFSYFEPETSFRNVSSFRKPI